MWETGNYRSQETVRKKFPVPNEHVPFYRTCAIPTGFEPVTFGLTTHRSAR